MDIKTYIESGVLELYVAGALPDNEMKVITEKVNQYPEIRKEVERLEQAFMAFASVHAPVISAELKESILNNTTNRSGSVEGLKSKRNQFSTTCKAILGLLLFSLLLNAWQYQNAQRSQETLEATKQENQIFAQDLKDLQSNYNLSKEQLATIKQPDTKTVILGSTGKVADAEAVVFWNPTTQRVYVDAAALPEPPEGKVYQLWWMISLDPLTPNDAGTLDDFASNEQKIFAAKPTDKAVAFAITLEPEGGSESPTLSELYVLGTVS